MSKKSSLSKLIAKSSVSIRYPMGRWSLLKTGTGSNLIHLSLSLAFGKKNIADGKEAYQEDQVQTCLLSYLSKESLVYS